MVDKKIHRRMSRHVRTYKVPVPAQFYSLCDELNRTAGRIYSKTLSLVRKIHKKKGFWLSEASTQKWILRWSEEICVHTHSKQAALQLYFQALRSYFKVSKETKDVLPPYKNRVYRCRKCGFVHHRDVVGALNILRKYLTSIGAISTVVADLAPAIGVRYYPHLCGQGGLSPWKQALSLQKSHTFRVSEGQTGFLLFPRESSILPSLYLIAVFFQIKGRYFFLLKFYHPNWYRVSIYKPFQAKYVWTMRREVSYTWTLAAELIFRARMGT